MLKTFKEIKKEISSRRKQTEFRRDEDGRAVVELCVRDDSDFLSPYSTGANGVINGEVAEFIETSMRPLHPDELVRLEIYSDEITEEEQKAYTAAIHGYYAEQYHGTLTELKRLVRLAAIMAAIGVIALAVTISLMATGKLEIISEVIDIFAWVFLWEAVDIFFLQRNLLKVKQKRNLALADCPVDYLPLEKIEAAISTKQGE